MAIRFPAGSFVGGVAVGGRYTNAAGIRTSTTKLPGGGIVRTSSRFPQIIGGVALRTQVSSKAAAERILDNARDNAPVGTGDSYVGQEGALHPGHLKESLYIFSDDLGSEWLVASDAVYAAYVEFGTSRQDPQPYLVPAMQAERGSYVRDTAIALKGL